MQPQSPNPNFDFMLKDQPQPGRNLPLTNLSKPVIYGVGGLFIVILLIIGLSLLSGRQSGGSQAYINVLARNQEILRVSAVAQPQLNDSQVQALAATITASLNSDKQQLTAYLTSRHIKPKPAQLAADLDANSDASLRTAAQNNNIDQAYITYLRDAMIKYQTELSNVYKASTNKSLCLQRSVGVDRSVCVLTFGDYLKSSSSSVSALLNSPPLKS